jgi:hypothetical protein
LQPGLDIAGSDQQALQLTCIYLPVAAAIGVGLYTDQAVHFAAGERRPDLLPQSGFQWS